MVERARERDRERDKLRTQPTSRDLKPTYDRHTRHARQRKTAACAPVLPTRPTTAVPTHRPTHPTHRVEHPAGRADHPRALEARHRRRNRAEVLVPVPQLAVLVVPERPRLVILGHDHRV